MIHERFRLTTSPTRVSLLSKNVPLLEVQADDLREGQFRSSFDKITAQKLFEDENWVVTKLFYK
jgi:hypothetical protein